ncbi:hypothetical protein [Sphingomonas sp. SUN039]|uniref:hypothetical protein n=1 Tax=Sphingomonas sp. SUN039 TaxID=2937787 RepID=UPI002164E0ED|nr:hypothetical protein [Sphingomonas sp. SUN039]UVO55605.1 hypothetical protein M0209_16325 [Sphingomonas sp. SUN039]
MSARILMLLALASLAFGNAAMARAMPMPGTMACTSEAACCPDSESGMPLSACVTCCVLAPALLVMPDKSETKPLAARAVEPAILLPRDVRPLDPPPRPLGQTENSI